MQKSDIFCLMDDYQFTRYDWQNRNRIMTANGPVTLTIPVAKRFLAIDCTPLVGNLWVAQHESAIWAAYGKSPGRQRIINYLDWAKGTFPDSGFLGQVATGFIHYFWRTLKLETHLIREYSHIRSLAGKGENPSDDISLQCRHFNADQYLCGESSFEYFDRTYFRGVLLKKAEWRPKQYPQKWTDSFIPNLSILDLIANVPENDRIREILD
tara:strand:+ start:1733 stop:2365 length:633 start_codon:yes stop_codon:yes gene_type:complete